jgi:hypothetical protein
MDGLPLALAITAAALLVIGGAWLYGHCAFEPTALIVKYSALIHGTFL